MDFEYALPFITFEGPDGSGKTSQAKRFADWSKAQGFPTLLTFEPGGGDAVSRILRGLLLQEKGFIQATEGFLAGSAMLTSHRAEFLGFCMERAQHVEHTILPALEDGKLVWCDRYLGSTSAYQLTARGACNLEEYNSISEYSIGGLYPDFELYLVVSIETARKRNAGTMKGDLFEKLPVVFHELVWQGYEDYFARQDPSRYARIDAEVSPDEVFEQILPVVKQLLVGLI